ncbi:type I polyketide synthase [Streptacidiphilus sp. 4-A2]|nr:type I polyketide synthase [Streptacidiphilus sp. 4-A2]
MTNDGRGSGLLLQPAVSGQVDTIREACRSAGVEPGSSNYVEAHGTGTAVGDNVELRALAEVTAAQSGDRRPLRIGSVKTNIGHTEAAAGIAGLIKVVLMAQHEMIPASLHMTSPNPLLAAETSALELVARNQPLDKAGPQALFGVSSFGLSGTNAHVVVGGYPRGESAQRRNLAELPAERPTHLLVLSARSRRSLLGLAGAYAEYLRPGGAGRDQPLWDICATAALRREAYPHRLWVLGDTHDEIADRLLALAAGEKIRDGGIGQAGGTSRTPVFVFPGQGSQWLGMGRTLHRSSTAFREALQACDAAVSRETGWSVIDLLFSQNDEFLGRVEQVQPVLWSLQVALAATWQDAGVDPELCLGHSMGEIAAAHISGALSLADAAAVVCRRSRLMSGLAGRGGMMAANISAPEAEALAGVCAGQVVIAAENAPTATVLAGDHAALEEIASKLDGRGVFNRHIQVTVASHSPFMDPLRADILRELAPLDPRKPDLEMISTVRCAPVSGADLDARYWMDNLRQPVRFASGVRLAAGSSPRLFVEISPHPVLTVAMEETLEQARLDSAVVGSTRRHQDESLQLARALGAFFALHGRTDWQRWFRGEWHAVQLPAYAWDEESLTRIPVLLPAAGTATHTRDYQQDAAGVGVRPHGLPVVPLSLCLALVLDTAKAVHGARDYLVEDGRPSPGLGEIPDGTSATLRVVLTGTAERCSASVWLQDPVKGPLLCLNADVRALPEPGAAAGAAGDTPVTDRTVEADQAVDLDQALGRCGEFLSREAFLRLAAARGYRITPEFHSVRQLWRRDGEAVATCASRPA